MNKKTVFFLNACILLVCVGCLARSGGGLGSQLNSQNTPLPSKAAGSIGNCGSGSICPGIGISGLILGDSEEEVIRKFGRSDYFRNQLNHPQCADVELNWGDATESDDMRGNGFRAYFLSGSAILIKADSLSVRTEQGLTHGSTPDQVSKAYPNLTAFLLRFSASELNGPRDLVYWVDKSGIAFEFYFNQETRRREVGYIYVFKPTTVFYPHCGVNILNDWIQLPRFGIEDPNSQGKLSLRHTQ